jgi:galactokinase
MVQSHESLRDDFEVSNDALNTMVDCALEADGCLGARMTGAGFGCCAVALVPADKTEAFVARVTKTYRERSGLKPAVYVSSATDGAGRA